MNDEILYTLIVAVLVVCLLLARYIYRQMSHIKSVKDAQIEQERVANERYQEQRAYLIESITVIAKAYGNDEKLTCTEACMRLSTLLQSFSPELLDRPEVSVIRQFHMKTEHIPIKEDWKALSKQERWRFMKEMASLEQEYGKDVLEATAYLANYDFDLIVQ
jgi:ubiquitin C-terminal hydrolase